MSSTCLIERRGAVLRVSLNRPQALNALDEALARELYAAARAATHEPEIRAVLLTGEGRGFCAGADLAPGRLPADPTISRGANTRRLLDEIFNPLVLAWRAIPKPVVVAVNGVAAGGGVGLALVGDLLLMAESATLRQVFVPQLGLVPDLGASYELPRRIGVARAKALALLGTPLTAAQAAAWGLALEAVPDAELPARALALAERLAALPTRACGEAKALLDAPSASFDEQLEREAQVQGLLGDSPDHAEGVAAFLEKRAPRFGGG